MQSVLVMHLPCLGTAVQYRAPAAVISCKVSSSCTCRAWAPPFNTAHLPRSFHAKCPRHAPAVLGHRRSIPRTCRGHFMQSVLVMHLPCLGTAVQYRAPAAVISCKVCSSCTCRAWAPPFNTAHL